MSVYPERQMVNDIYSIQAEGDEIPGLRCHQQGEGWTVSLGESSVIEVASKDEIERWGWLIGRLLRSIAPADDAKADQQRPNWVHLSICQRQVMRLPKPALPDGPVDSPTRCEGCAQAGTVGCPQCMGQEAGNEG